MKTLSRFATPFVVGLLVALAAPAPVLTQEPPPGAAAGVRLDFQDAELRIVLAALAEAGGLNVVYSDLPARRVTLRLARPVRPDQVPDLLRSVARANGLTVVEDGELLRIVGAAPGEGSRAAEAEAADPGQPLRLYVHRLRHARAPRIAATLQAIFGGGSGAAYAAPARSLPLSERLREQAIPPFDPAVQPDVVVELDPEPGRVDLPGQLTGEVQIVPDEATNSLLVRATPADWAVIEQAVQSLDLRPLQVLIEVVIAEVRRTSDLDVGVRIDVGKETDDVQIDVVTGAAGTAARGAGDLVLDVMRSAGSLDVQAFFTALATDGHLEILSRPVILAQNNQEARILIGDERPFIQVFRSLPTDAAVRDQVVQYRDVGTALSILPTINDDGYVNLQLTQEVSTATEETQFGAPVISTREASTQLFVRDGQTVVIGGLIDRQETWSESGVPLLKDIPLLGNLFKSRSRGTSRSELFFFLTPRIIVTDEDADAAREEMEGRIELPADTLRIPPVRP